MRGYLITVIALCFALSACEKPVQGHAKSSSQTEPVAAQPTPRAGHQSPKIDANQVTPSPFDTQVKFDDMPVQGDVVGGLKWTDKLGENLVFFSERESAVGPREDLDIPDEPARVRALFAAHYLKPRDGSATELKRLVRDAAGPCQFNLTGRFIKASYGVSDLDDDGVGEATFAYELACLSDVSPKTLKLLVLEGGEKFILRGTRVTKMGSRKTMGGDFTPGASLTNADPAFLRHASKLWKQIARPEP